MDTLQNMRAFLAVVAAGSFSGAARRLGVATSVVAKRVDQLEAGAGVRLFNRSTRAVSLNEAGLGWIARVRSLVADADDVMGRAARAGQELEGPMRVKAPTTLTVLHLADAFARFQVLHPKVVLDVVLTDRPVNPVDEGFDMAIAVFGTAFGGVSDLPLCPMRRVLCASPGYVARRGRPGHPRDLVGHDTLSFGPTGHVWPFGSPQGPVLVEVSPRLSANDGTLLLAGALAGNGIAMLSEYVALPALRCGDLVTVLDGFPLPEIWLKALVPEARMAVSRIGALAAFLQDHFSPPPWERDAGEMQPPGRPC